MAEEVENAEREGYLGQNEKAWGEKNACWEKKAELNLAEIYAL